MSGCGGVGERRREERSGTGCIKRGVRWVQLTSSLLVGLESSIVAVPVLIMIAVFVGGGSVALVKALVAMAGYWWLNIVVVCMYVIMTRQNCNS